MADRRLPRRRRLRLAALIALAAGPLLGSMFLKPAPLLLWNLSASMPRGLYLVRSEAEPRRGDMVIAWTPGPARALAAERRYLPSNVPLLKEVAARAGDRICARGAAIFVKGRRVAHRFPKDSIGRALPHWSGCRTLGAGEYLLLGRHPRSFDGRNFGVTDGKDIIGLAEQPWVR